MLDVYVISQPSLLVRVSDAETGIRALRAWLSPRCSGLDGHEPREPDGDDSELDYDASPPWVCLLAVPVTEETYALPFH